jgi:hypothetical protein
MEIVFNPSVANVVLFGGGIATWILLVLGAQMLLTWYIDLRSGPHRHRS